MKKAFFLLLLIISISCSAQKQGYIWYFGSGSGLDFSGGIPDTISGGKTGTDNLPGESQEGTASISDSIGNILFYTGGETIWNREHRAMPNGNNIMGGISSTQSSIIVPKPGSNDIFFVFTSDEFQSYFNPPQNGYRYSVVDMCLDSGRGDVFNDQKNILLLDSATEKIAACGDISGNGYWIMGHKMFSDQFNAWHLTTTGISNTIISHIGTVHGWSYVNASWVRGAAQGQMKFNAQGTKLALVIGNFNPAILDLFDFNNSSGVVSNSCHITIDSLLGKSVFGVEFSPDGSKIYVSVAGGFGGKRLYQYDLTAGGGDCNSIIASRTTIFESNTNSIMFGMQLAPDNKIYLVGNAYYDLSRINFPNLAGTAVSFDSSVISISGIINNYTLPAFIAGYKYHNAVPCQLPYVPVFPVDSSCRLDINTKLYPNPFSHTLVVNKKRTNCKVTLNMYNMIGQLILKGKAINDGENKIHLSHLASGIYYYKFISNGIVLLSGRILRQ